MKVINCHFEDFEFEELIKYKKRMSWHDFILLLTKRDKDEK